MNLTKWDKAKQAIAECKTIDEVKQIRDKAEALRAYAKQAKESLQVQNDIAEIKLRAERRIGEFARELPKAKNQYEKCPPQDGESKTAILQEAGITHCERYEAIASLPDEVFEKHIENVKASNEELTTVGILKVARQLQKDVRLENKLLPLPKNKYCTIVIDPPWPIEKIIRDERPDQSIIDYPTMTIENIKLFPIHDIACEDGCHVYLWTTHKYMPVAFEIFEAWGVKYQCLLTWVKNVGMTPFSFMYSTEHVLFGRIGTLDLLKNGERLDFTAKATGHSRKPDAFYELIKKVSPAPRIDVFNRREIDGFDRYGNEL